MDSSENLGSSIGLILSPCANTRLNQTSKSSSFLYCAMYPSCLCLTISGTHQISKVTTGQPQANHSKITKGQLSARVGYKKQSAAEKNKLIFSYGINHNSRYVFVLCSCQLPRERKRYQSSFL